MSYTDLSSTWAYKGLVRWSNMDAHAENAAIVYDNLGNKQFIVSNAAGQSISNGTTKLLFDTEDLNTDGIFDISNDKAITTILGPWLFSLSFFVPTAAVGATSNMDLYSTLYKNGSAFRDGNSYGGLERGGASAFGFGMFLTTIVNVTSITDYFEFYVTMANAAASYTLTAIAMGSRIGVTP